MRDKYFPPTFDEKQFHCIYCGVYSQQYWIDAMIISKPGGWIQSGIRLSICTHCATRTYWYEGKMVVPAEAPIEPPHPDLPETCKQDYIEARNIFVNSPRAAAALLRLCIQKLLQFIGEKGENINNDIKSLVDKGLPILVQRALDYCRVVGNNAVHPGEIELNDTPEIAQELFNMINFIVEDRITRPREIEELYRKLPEESRNAIEKRDAKSGKENE